MLKTSRLYRRIYKYIFLSVALAVVLTFAMLQFSFHLNNQERKENFVKHIMEHQAGTVLFLLQEVEKNQSTEVLVDRARQLGKDLNWEIRYIPSPVPDSIQKHLRQRHRAITSIQKNGQNLVFGALKPGQPEAGVLEFKMPEPHLDGRGRPPLLQRPPGRPPGGPPPPGRPPGEKGPPPPRRHPERWFPPHIQLALILISVLLILLGLFLIPLVRYFMRPLTTLSEAFNQVSDGHFNVLPEMDQEFQPMVDAFNHMTTEIQAMLKEKQRLIADVSHELRSPLARMRVSMELLAKEGKGKAKYIDRAIREIEELDHLINDLLDVSALDLNAEQSPLEKINIQEWASTILDNHELWFEQNQVEVRRHFDMQPPIFIQGRKHLLDRALNNLLSNLVKHAPENSHADIFIEQDQEHIILRLRDRGPGVPAAALEKLTEPFYRVDTSRTRKTGGTGLGLAIVHKIMMLHQGKVRFSTPTDAEGGLMVSLCFPVPRSFRKTGRLVIETK